MLIDSLLSDHSQSNLEEHLKGPIAAIACNAGSRKQLFRIFILAIADAALTDDVAGDFISSQLKMSPF